MIKGLPEKLKLLRTKSNLSQKEAANRLGISPSIVSSYETGERTPSTENLHDCTAAQQIICWGTTSSLAESCWMSTD